VKVQEHAHRVRFLFHLEELGLDDVMDRTQMGAVDGVLGDLLRVALELPADRSILRPALLGQGLRGPGGRASVEAVVHEDDAVLLDERPGYETLAFGGDLRRVGDLDALAAVIEGPAVKRAAQAVAFDLSAAEVRAQVGAGLVERRQRAVGATEQHEVRAEVVHGLDLAGADVRREPDDEPALRKRREGESCAHAKNASRIRRHGHRQK